MNATTYGWIVLGSPLVGALLLALGFRRLPGKAAGWLGTGAIGVSFLAAIGMLLALLYREEESRYLFGTAFT